MPPAQAIEVRINELVLDGFQPAARHRIGEAVERELTRLLSEQGAPEVLMRSKEMADLAGGSFPMNPRTEAESIGEQVARAVYGGMQQ